MSKELETCPKCGGHADNGFSREIPPSPYYCRACMAEDRIEQLERENAAQLAELHAISDAIGTSDGHSSVYWINAILADNARLREALLEISQVACSLSPEQKIANEALAKVRKP